MMSVRTDAVAKRLFLRLLMFSTASLALAQQNNDVTKSCAWSGVLVSSACNADEAFNESPECAKESARRQGGAL